MKRKLLSATLSILTIGTLFTGCTKTPEEIDIINDVNEINNNVNDNDTDNIIETEPTPVSQSEVPKPNPDCIKKVTDYYSQMYENYAIKDHPDIVYLIYEYSDNYQGCFRWQFEDYLYMSYYADYVTASGQFEISTLPEENLSEVFFIIRYDDGSVFELEYGVMDTDTIGPAIEDIENANLTAFQYDGDFENHDVQKDLLILYERFRELADKAMKEAGVDSLNDLGIILSSSDKIDPSTPLSFETPFLTKEHNFENGVCTDCNMTWSEYIIDAFGELQNNPDWEIQGGVQNEYMDVGDSVLFYNLNNFIEADYLTKDLYSEPNRNISQDFAIGFTSKDTVKILFTYTDENGWNSDDGTEAVCRISFTADTKEVLDILSSPDKIKKSATYEILSFDPGIDEAVDFRKNTDIDPETFMAKYNYTIISEDELCELLTTGYRRYILAIDKSLVNTGSSLSDAGIDIASLN